MIKLADFGLPTKLLLPPPPAAGQPFSASSPLFRALLFPEALVKLCATSKQLVELVNKPNCASFFRFLLCVSPKHIIELAFAGSCSRVGVATRVASTAHSGPSSRRLARLKLSLCFCPPPISSSCCCCCFLSFFPSAWLPEVGVPGAKQLGEAEKRAQRNANKDKLRRKLLRPLNAEVDCTLCSLFGAFANLATPTCERNPTERVGISDLGAAEDAAVCSSLTGCFKE